MLDFIQQYSGALSFVATCLLVLLTAFYAVLTRGILKATANQSRLALNPVIGINVTGIKIGETFGPGRRNLNVSLELTNVGNAPAIELSVDSEIELRYSTIEGESAIPARFEPDVIPFLRPDETTDKARQCFGTQLIEHFLDDVREAKRLNLFRIEHNPTRESFRTSRLRVFVSYRNSLGQHFKSVYETEIVIWEMNGEDNIPSESESADITQVYVPRPIFHAGIDEPRLASRELAARDAKRNLCGW